MDSLPLPGGGDKNCKTAKELKEGLQNICLEARRKKTTSAFLTRQGRRRRRPVVMADEEVAVEESASPAQSPLVAVTFQRNAKRKEKYLEAEPKALGITQICLSVYNIIGIGVFQAKHLGISELNIPLLISSLLILIAGNVAVAAKNLHLPKLRACLGMQIVSCAASVLNVILIFIQMGALSYRCWYSSYDHNSTLTHEEICRQIETIQNHFFGGGVLIQATLLAISATLAAYCCKVVNCCAPAPKMPVITIHSPPVQQRED